MSLRPRQILTDIADAVRERASLANTVFIRPTGANGFAARIRALTVGTGANPDARRFFLFRDFLTPTQEQEQNLVRLDGRPLWSTVNAALHTMFKVGPNWQTGVLSFSPNRVFDTFLVVGNNLYMGSSTSLTTITIINTLNGNISTITGLPSRTYSRLDLQGNFIYCHHQSSSMSGWNTLVRIDTTNNSFIQINLPSGRIWAGIAKIGTKWFMSSIIATKDLVYLDISTEPPTIGTIANVTTADRAQHIIIGPNSKIYLASSSPTDYLVVIDTTRIGTSNPVVQEIIGLPNRTHMASLLAGRYLYISDASSTARDTIVCVDTTTESVQEITVPSRRYSIEVAARAWAFTGILIGNKVYVGHDWSTAASIVVINNTTRAVSEITVPSRVYRMVPQQEYVNWNFSLMPPPMRIHTTGTAAGAKIYMAHSGTSATTIAMITTNASWPATDPVTEITGFPSRQYTNFYLNGAATTGTLYCLSDSSATTIEMINLSTDARITTPITGLVSQNYHVAWVWGTGVNARMAVSGTYTRSNLPIINLSNNTLAENVTGLAAPNRSHTHMVFLNNKIYTGSTGAFDSMLVLGDSALPSHPNPLYIRPPD